MNCHKKELTEDHPPRQQPIHLYGNNRLPDYATMKNNSAIADAITPYGKPFKATIIMTSTDYQELSQNNSDFTISKLSFSVTELIQTGFNSIRKEGQQPTCAHSFKSQNENLTVADNPID